MNYTTHYQRLIARARIRALTGYRERHHVIPRCMGGDDSPTNLVGLTPEEHYVAHQLLVKMYPWSKKLLSAVVLMAQRYSPKPLSLSGQRFGRLVVLGFAGFNSLCKST